MKLRLLSVSIMLCLAVSFCQAQRVPSWMNELPKPGNSSIMYVRESGEGATQTQAVNMALARVMQNTAFRIGQPFDSQRVNAALQEGSNYEVVAQQYNIPIHKVDEYAVSLKDGGYRVFVLCQVAVSGNVSPQWEALQRAGEAGNWTALLKSAVVPGLGQMGKGYYAEGVFTLAGQLAAIGAGVGCYFMAQDDLAVMRNYATSYTDFSAAQKHYNTLRTTSQIVWSEAGVIYVYNLVRAVTMQPKSANMLVVEPSILSTPQGIAPSMGFAFHF